MEKAPIVKDPAGISRMPIGSAIVKSNLVVVFPVNSPFGEKQAGKFNKTQPIKKQQIIFFIILKYFIKFIRSVHYYNAYLLFLLYLTQMNIVT